MPSGEDSERLTFFDYIDYFAAENGIPRDSAEYAHLVEDRLPLYIFTRDLGRADKRWVAIVEIQRNIRVACDQYEEIREEELTTAEDLEIEEFGAEEIAEFNARYVAGTFLLIAYTLAREFIDDIAVQIAKKEELHTEDKNVSEMKLKTVVERLHEEDIIADDLKDDIDHVVSRRNALAHDIDERYTLSGFGDDLVKETVKPLYAVDGLYYTLYGEHAYIPATEAKDARES